MDRLNQLGRPIVTGAPATSLPAASAQPGTVQTGNSFLSVLKQQLETGSDTAFSKHAVSRVMERQIDVSEANLLRLNQGVKLAQEKGMNEALILIDRNAYIVNAASGKVITVDGQAQEGSAYTNIDGTVII